MRFLGSPFAEIGNPTGNVDFAGSPNMANVVTPTVDFGKITDGLSNTVLASESVVGQSSSKNDLRGFSHWSFAAQYTGWIAPNSTQPDKMLPLKGSAYYNYPYLNNPPAQDATDTTGTYMGARSWHPGGVNVGMVVGSVKFLKDSVNLSTWRALSTTQGGESATADAF